MRTSWTTRGVDSQERRGSGRLAGMTHTHIAGSIHADAAQAGPTWLRVPEDLNELDAELWPRGTRRDEHGRMLVAGVALTDLAQEHATPTYLIDEEDFRSRARDFRTSFPGWGIYYAGKALLTRRVARWAAEEGLNLDVTTMGEMKIALAGGMPAERLGFHGNNKSEEEIDFALDQGVGRIIVDSFDEIARLEAACEARDRRANVVISVRSVVVSQLNDLIVF